LIKELLQIEDGGDWAWEDSYYVVVLVTIGHYALTIYSLLPTHVLRSWISIIHIRYLISI
jgi:hypothetical protein